jgi:RNA polymerase sigma-B factor
MTSTMTVDGTSALASHPAGGATVEELLRQRAHLAAGNPDRAVLRARCIEASLPLARRLAARYRGRGEPLDDLYQIAALGLIKAVDGYDPTRQVAFSSYAVPTIVGLLKRHFRDTTWRIRVPRRVQELAVRIGPTSARLAQQLGRSPSLTELAAQLDAAKEDVAAALDAWRLRRPEPLEALSATGGQERRPIIETIGAIDARLEAVADRHLLHPLLAALPNRERRILAMRYVGDLTQIEIAAQVGLSQMHVSRLLVRTLRLLRVGLLAEQPARATRRQPGPPAVRRISSSDAAVPPGKAVPDFA